MKVPKVFFLSLFAHLKMVIVVDNGVNNSFMQRTILIFFGTFVV